MPIHSSANIRSLTADEFDALDYRVMGHAYTSQNELGRLCDECAYEADMKVRLLADGFRSVQIQVPLTVTHGDFSKTYRLDLIADDALYELKADANLAREHEAQLYNYMFLLGIQRGKLLNFCAPKVQGKLLATSLTQQERRRFVDVCDHWSELSPACATLRRTMLALLQDWGAFLEVGLYQEALIHFLGGLSNVERRVNLQRNGLDLGTQRMFVHAPGVAFRLMAVTEGQEHVESHLRRLLALTNLKGIQWINLNHAQIEFRTILKAGE
jgi:GxxExxY protein